MNHPIVIVGAGLAGLWTALKLAPRDIIVISAAALGEGAASAWAQGGIAAALGNTDSASNHAADTKTAGAGLNKMEFVDLLTQNIGREIEALIRLGIYFDRNADGFLLSREAGHSQRRIVRSAGDMAGHTIMHGLTQAAQRAAHISLIENCRVGRLAYDDNHRVLGVWVERGEGWELIEANAVVLAVGGIGQLYQMTTNPPQALGTGLAMAAEAGAYIADAEFVQFHPTAMAIGTDPAPLATEALRGEGALLRDRDGHRFMLEEHESAELAPRDIVARAVAKAIAGGGAFLDVRAMTQISLPDHFPIICEACAQIGLDPKKDLIPIAPAAHYHMGGVACNEYGRTSLDGLWVCGEVAANGMHGANRLAGNSLGEALVFAHLLADDILATEMGDKKNKIIPAPRYSNRLDDGLKANIKKIMSHHVGVVRDQSGLETALTEIERLKEKTSAIGDENLLIAAEMIALAALQRRESRGAHYRSDYPNASADQATHSMLTLADTRKIPA